MWEINFVASTLLGKDWFCLSFCWKKSRKYRYILKALSQNCSPDLLFPWSPLLQWNTLPLSKSSFPKATFGVKLCGERNGYSHSRLFHQRDRDPGCFSPLPAASLSILNRPALWNMAGYECERGRACSFRWRTAPLWGCCFLSEIVIYRHLLVPRLRVWNSRNWV